METTGVGQTGQLNYTSASYTGLIDTIVSGKVGIKRKYTVLLDRRIQYHGVSGTK